MEYFESWQCCLWKRSESRSPFGLLCGGRRAAQLLWLGATGHLPSTALMESRDAGEAGEQGWRAQCALSCVPGGQEGQKCDNLGEKGDEERESLDLEAQWRGSL